MEELHFSKVILNDFLHFSKAKTEQKVHFSKIWNAGLYAKSPS